MRRIKWVIGLAGVLSLATAVSATTTPYTSCSGTQNVWCFASNPTQVSDGATYSTIAGSSVTGAITVYSEQVTNSNNNFYKFSDSTINGLFSTNDTVVYNTDTGIGIAPYNPSETDYNFTNQDGITDAVGTNNYGGTNTNYGNILLLNISNVAAGTTLSFLLQEGPNTTDPDSAVFYYQNGGSVNVGMNQGISPSGMTSFGTVSAGQITTTGGSPQISLVRDSAATEWVAIEADCHYMLLSSITGTAPMSGVPEPRFYGLLLASLLGIAGVVYQRRRTAQTNG